MTEVLHAWIEGEHVGVFSRKSAHHAATFQYDTDAQHDVSLSVARGERLSKMAPQNFLGGLIPEDPGTRQNMKDLTGAKSDSSWDLLSAVDGDLTGGVVLTSGPDAVDRGSGYAYAAQEQEVAARVERIKRGGSGLGGFDSPPRFSLAGAQGKFALAIDGTDLYWPDAATPSTHIVKPARLVHPGLDEIEAASLELARNMQISAAEATVMKFRDQSSFVTTRFDRRLNADGTVSRIHMEDVAQALGLDPSAKYLVGAPRTIQLLMKSGVDSDVPYDFIEQLAFNVAIGNADAHAKNYTLIHGPRGVSLSPIYDTVPILLFPEYAQKLGMRIGNQRNAISVTLNNWRTLSSKTGLDHDRVEAIVVGVNERFLDCVESTIAQTEVGRNQSAKLDLLKFNAERVLKHSGRPNTPTAPLPGYEPREASARTRRRDIGLGKTAAGGTSSSFAKHYRSTPSAP